MTTAGDTSAPRARIRREHRVLLAVIVGTFALYAGAALVIAGLTGQPAATVPVWMTGVAYPAWSLPAVLLFGLSGAALALFIPGVPWALALRRGQPGAGGLFSHAFGFNIVQAVIVISVWKAFAGVVPPRPIFIGWQALVAVSGLFVLLRRHRPAPFRGGIRAMRSLLVAGAVLLILLPSFLWGKTFFEDADGDGTEAFEFSRSLATHQLPHWDLENGYYGFYPNFMFFAYPTQLSFIAIGETEGGQRLLNFFYILGVFLILRDLVSRGRRAISGMELSLLLGACVFFIVYHAFHTSYAVVVDLGEPLGVDLFFTFLAAAAFHALVTRRRVWWALFSLLMTLALSSGFPLVLLFLAAHIAVDWPPHRQNTARRHVGDVLAFVLPWLAYQLFVYAYSTRYPLGVTKWAFSNVMERYPLQFEPAAALTILAGLGLTAAFAPIVALGIVFMRRDATARALALATLGYLATLVFFGRTHPHYLIPICLFPAAIYLRLLRGPNVSARLRRLGYGAYSVLLVVLLFVVTPQDRAPVTTYREFGARTLMLYDSYPELIETLNDPILGRRRLRVFLPEGKAALPWQRTIAVGENWTETVSERLVRPSQIAAMRGVGRPEDRTPWGISFHTWVRYADKAPVAGRQYDLILAAPHLAPPHPDGYARRDLAKGWVLYFRPEQSLLPWLADGVTTR